MSLEMQALIKALNEQTAAINQLVQVTAALIQAVAAQDNVDDEDELPRSQYLDGSPVER